MSVSNVPKQTGGQPPAPPTKSEEAVPRPPSPPRASVDAPRLREVEQLLSAPEWQGLDGGGGPRTQAPGEGLEELSGARLFPSDPRVVFVLLNEARYRVIQGVFGVRRDQVNMMTLIATMTVAEVVHRKTEVLRRGLRGPTRADVVVGHGLVNVLGQEVAGPYSQEIPFFAALIGTAAVGAVTTRVVRQATHDMKAASHRIKRSFSYLIPRGTRSGSAQSEDPSAAAARGRDVR